MTTPIRDVIASFEGGLGELRQARAWQGINRKLDATSLVTAAATASVTKATVASVVLPASIGAAVIGAVAMFAVMRTTAVSSDSPADVPSFASVAAPVEPIPSPEHVVVQVEVEKPKRAAKREVRATTAPVPRVALKQIIVTPDELYRRAEAALVVHERTSARDILQHLLADFPQSPLVDAARYDLALIAVAEHDDAGALLLLDEVIASGREPNVVTAARRLRRVVTPE